MSKSLEQKLAQLIQHQIDVTKGIRSPDTHSVEHMIMNDAEIAAWLDGLNKAGEMGSPMFNWVRKE